MKKKILSLVLALTMVFGVLLPVAAVPETAVTANAATCPIDGATGAGTEADPVVVDNYNELIKALNYGGTLYILAKSFDTSRLDIQGTAMIAPITTKKVLILDQNLEIKRLDAAASLFKVADGGDFTITADSHRTIKYTYTVVEACHANAKVTLDGAIELQTTNNDKTDVYSYALRCYTGKTFISNAVLSSAQFSNNAATIKNVSVSGNVSLKGIAFTLQNGSIGYLGDKEQTFLACPDFGANVTYRKELKVRCVGGFQEQSPAMPEGLTTAAEEKVFLGMDKVYEFSTRGNPGWSMDQNYSPYGTLLIIDSSNGIVWSAQDDDSGFFDGNVSLSVNLKDKIKTPGKYKIREVIILKKDGNEVKRLVHEFPIEVVDFNEFLGQSPSMLEDNTEYYLGEVKQASYLVKFYSHSLPQSMIDEGYKSIAILKVYKNDADNTYVFGIKADRNKGQKISYDLNNHPAGIYRLVETIELRNKDNKVVKSAENTFYIDWTPQQDIKEVNITANWQGTISAPVCTTKGVKIVSYSWEKYDGSDWNTLDTSTPITGGGRYRCMVELAAETGYKLASSYTVKIGGVAAKQIFGGVDLWAVARDITGYLNFVDIEHSNAPEAGAYPEFEGYEIVQAGDTSVELVEWYKCDKNGKKFSEPLTEDDMFEMDSYYRLEVTVAPSAIYEFKNDAAFYINGESVYYNTSHGSDIPGSITGYKVYHVDSCRHDLFKHEKAEATCIADGAKYDYYTCDVCDGFFSASKAQISELTFKKDIFIPKTDHNYKLHKKQGATCTADGAKYDYYTCDVCDGIFSASKVQISEMDFKTDIRIPKLSHKLTAVGANPATCTTNGNIAHWKCERANCGMLFSDAAGTTAITNVTVKSSGHSYEWVVTKPAKVGVAGEKVNKCKICGNVKETQKLPALEPEYILGDADMNGKLESADARKALRAAVGLEIITVGTAQFKAADADKSGKLESADARKILRAVVGLEILK